MESLPPREEGYDGLASKSVEGLLEWVGSEEEEGVASATLESIGDDEEAESFFDVSRAERSCELVLLRVLRNGSLDCAVVESTAQLSNERWVVLGAPSSYSRVKDLTLFCFLRIDWVGVSLGPGGRCLSQSWLLVLSGLYEKAEADSEFFW